jgi:hypothetical protein
VRGIAPQQRRLQAFPEIPVKMMVRIQACFCNPDWKEARLPRKSATISIASGNKNGDDSPCGRSLSPFEMP